MSRKKKSEVQSQEFIAEEKKDSLSRIRIMQYRLTANLNFAPASIKDGDSFIVTLVGDDGKETEKSVSVSGVNLGWNQHGESLKSFKIIQKDSSGNVVGESRKIVLRS